MTGTLDITTWKELQKIIYQTKKIDFAFGLLRIPPHENPKVRDSEKLD
jgi:hypothetical protein